MHLAHLTVWLAVATGGAATNQLNANFKTNKVSPAND